MRQSSNAMEARKLIKWGLYGLGAVITIGYSFFVLEDFARGPRIVISSPQSGFSTTTSVITIVGQAIHTNNLTINDASTPVDLNGNFRSQLILAPGYNIIKVAAKDNYARTVEKVIEMNLIGEHLTNDTASRTFDKGTGTTTQATTTIN